MMTDAPLKKHTPTRSIAQPINEVNANSKQTQINTNVNNQLIQYNNRPSQIEYDSRTKKDMMYLRRQKLKEMLDEELEEYKFEMVSRDKSNYTPMTDQSISMKPQSIYHQQDSLSRPLSSFSSIPSQTSSYTQSNKPVINKEYNDSSNKYFPEPKPNYYNKNQFGIEPIRDSYVYVNANATNNNQIGHSEFDVNRELDLAIKKYADNLDKLKVDEFMSRKKIQDDLLKKINSKLVKINHEMNDKIYQENIAEQWFNSNNSNQAIDNYNETQTHRKQTSIPSPIYTNSNSSSSLISKYK